MKSYRSISACNLLVFLASLLPAVENRFDDGAVHRSTLYGVVEQVAPQLSLRGWAPFLALAVCTVIGVSLTFISWPPQKRRIVARSIGVVAFLSVVDLGWAAFVGLRHPGFFIIPASELSACFGLWTILGLEFLAIILAWRVPHEINSAREGTSGFESAG